MSATSPRIATTLLLLKSQPFIFAQRSLCALACSAGRRRSQLWPPPRTPSPPHVTPPGASLPTTTSPFYCSAQSGLRLFNSSAAKMSTSCCPPGSWGELKKDADYKDKGKVVRLGKDLDVYVAGGGDKCIVWSYDIFGFDSGRTRQMVDVFADQGFMVVLPDYYRGKFITPEDPGLVKFVEDQTKWEGGLKADLELVIAHAKEKGAKAFGAIGTCWGSYPVIRLSACPDFKAGVSMHPSHTPICGMVGVDEKELLGKVGCPQLFMPAAEDHENVKPGGLGEQILGKDKLTVVQFPDMSHGWTTRGDLSDATVKRDVEKAISEALGFFKKHLC